MAATVDLTRLEDFDRDVLDMAVQDRAEAISTTDTRAEIAYFLEGAAFQHSPETASVLRDLAQRIRRGEYP